MVLETACSPGPAPRVSIATRKTTRNGA